MSEQQQQERLCEVCGEKATKKLKFPDKVVLLCGEECSQYVGAEGNILQRAAEKAKAAATKVKEGVVGGATKVKEGAKKLLPSSSEKQQPQQQFPQQQFPQQQFPQQQFPQQQFPQQQQQPQQQFPQQQFPQQQFPQQTQQPQQQFPQQTQQPQQQFPQQQFPQQTQQQPQQQLPRQQPQQQFPQQQQQLPQQQLPQRTTTVPGERVLQPSFGSGGSPATVVVPGGTRVLPSQTSVLVSPAQQQVADPLTKIRPISRQLWQDHVSKTRDVITSTIDASKASSTQQQSNRLEEDQSRLLRAQLGRASDLDVDINQVLRSNQQRKESMDKFVKELVARQDLEVQRLRGNQREIGTFVGSVLDNAKVGFQFADLLIVHINGAAAILGEAAANPVTAQQGLQVLGNDPKVRSATIGRAGGQKSTNPLVASIQRWYDNGDDIVRFLDSFEAPALPAFPGGPAKAVQEKVWPESTIRPAFYMHLYQTIVEAVQYLNGDYRGSIQTADQATDHMMAIADIIANGLVRLRQPRDLERAASNAESAFINLRKTSTVFEK